MALSPSRRSRPSCPTTWSARAADGAEADAVVWEEVTTRTSESSELSISFSLFMILTALIASVGILLDSPIVIVGAMVVGPEFGPIAGICVAVLQRRRDMARDRRPALVVERRMYDRRRRRHLAALARAEGNSATTD